MEENTEPIVSPPPDEFHIGLTMAGAASAGCYTAGVMDYLFEILDLWEKAKNRELDQEWGHAIYKFVPQHKVIIDAMGGTSAGGMTTVMSAIYALNGKINPVVTPEEKNVNKENIFYDSWVLMGDGYKNGEKPTKDKALLFERTLATNDLKSTGKIQSLLNSDFIDSICDDAFKDDVKQKKKPVYISDELEVVLSHTMLRSVPLAIDFTTHFGKLKKKKNNPEHNTFDHFTTSHFKLDYDAAKPGHKDYYLPLDPFGPGAAAMMLATKATGAFPIGLRFREFFAGEFTTPYIQHMAEKIVFERTTSTAPPDKITMRWPTDFPNPFNFVSVDGGAINNEPFGEVLDILKSRYGTRQPDEDYKYALIMIDPFPDLVSNKVYKQPDDLFSAVPAIIGTLWDQAKVKRAEMLDAYSNDYYRAEIFPARYSYSEQQGKYIPEENKIACGAALAFSGFFDIDFRHHDFFLGRDNAKNFFKIYFSFEYDPGNGIVHPIHTDWTTEMVKYFKFHQEGKTFLPIIPNMHLLKDKILGDPVNPYEHVVAEWPQYDPEKLFAQKNNLKMRVKKMLELAYKKTKTKEEKKEKDKRPDTEKWIKRNYHSNILKKFTGWIGGGVLRLVFSVNKGKIAGRITRAAIEWILKDLEAKGLLKKVND